MRIVRGKYINGEVRLDEKVEIEGQRTVYVIFPDFQIRYVEPFEMMKIKGLICAGGDAVKDSEDIYEQ